MVGHCNFLTSYSVEFEPQDPVRDLVGDIGELKKIRIGDKEIDRKLIIRTNDKDLTINLFKDEEFKKYLDALYGLQHFKISPGRITLVTINLTYTSYNVVNAYHLIKRVTGLLSFFSSSAKESITISYPPYEKTSREEKPPDEIPIMKTISVPKNLNETSTVTKVPDMKNDIHVMFTLEDFKKEFTELQSLVTKIDFKPNRDKFNQVIVKPWISGITEIKHDLTSPMKVTGFGQRYSSPSKPIKFSVIKLKDIQQQYPTFSELKDAVKVTASDKAIEEYIQEKYELLRLVAQIKGLTNFVAECSSEKIIASLACELNPQNIKGAYDTLIEAVNILKMII